MTPIFLRADFNTSEIAKHYNHSVSISSNGVSKERNPTHMFQSSSNDDSWFRFICSIRTPTFCLVESINQSITFFSEKIK